MKPAPQQLPDSPANGAGTPPINGLKRALHLSSSSSSSSTAAAAAVIGSPRLATGLSSRAVFAILAADANG